MASVPAVPVVTASAPAPAEWAGAYSPVVGPPPAPLRRRGIPPGLALATIIAATPMLIGLVAGISALIAGQQVSSASSDYSWSDSSGGDLSSEFDAFGDATTGVGVAVAVVSAIGLLAAIAMAGGRNGGRVVTALWMVLACVYLLTQLEGNLSGAAAPYYLLVFGPPVVALLGMFTDASNQVFRSP